MLLPLPFLQVTMFKKATSKLASLFGQLAEAQQQIDDSARKIVEGIVRMIDVVDDEAPSSREALAGRDFTWYQETASTLTSDGFSSPSAFEPRAWMSRPVETRSIAEYALGDGGAIVASWFVTNATEKRPEHRLVGLVTMFADGVTFQTLAGGVDSSLPSLDTERDERLPEGTPVSVMLARHRARMSEHSSTPQRFESVDAYLAARQELKERRTAYRRGLGLSLVENYIEAKFSGDRAEVGQAYLDSIRKHPEWYKYANGNSEVPDSSASSSADGQSGESAPAPAMPLNFMISPTDDGRRTLTTFGMLFAGLPELLMIEVAANHTRAARVLAGTVAIGIARGRSASRSDVAFVAQLVSDSGMRITVTRADAITAGVTQVGDDRSSLPVDVHLVLRGFTAEDEPSMLLVNPLPDEPGSFDERLREACARVGADVPAARGAETADDAMREAHERAVARLGEVRERWKTRVGAEEKVLVKFRASQGDRGEYVWLEVHDWRDGEVDGVVVTPAPRVGLSDGQHVTIELSQVYDQLALTPSGAALPALTDLVASDYGMDI